MNDKLNVNLKTEISENLEDEDTLKERELTALYIAVNESNEEIVKILLTKSDINVNQYSTVNKEYEQYHHYDDWEDHCDDSFSLKILPIHVAVENENVEIVKLLLSNNSIDVNLTKYLSSVVLDENIKKEVSSLFIAVKNENIEIVKLLLSNNSIDVNFLNVLYNSKKDDDEHNKTVLHQAVENDSLDIIKCLLENENIDVNVEDEIFNFRIRSNSFTFVI